MRRSRDFRKRVKLYQITEVTDGFGGYTIEDQLLTTTWAEIKSISQKPQNDILTDFGINNANLAITITVRKRNDLTYNTINQYITYNGDKYNILTFPENKNFDNRFITFLAYKEPLKSAPIIEPLNIVNSIYNDYKERFTFVGGSESCVSCQKYFINELING